MTTLPNWLSWTTQWPGPLCHFNWQRFRMKTAQGNHIAHSGSEILLAVKGWISIFDHKCRICPHSVYIEGGGQGFTPHPTKYRPCAANTAKQYFTLKNTGNQYCTFKDTAKQYYTLKNTGKQYCTLKNTDNKKYRPCSAKHCHAILHFEKLLVKNIAT